jgi:curved DNA-binding protein CbpA
MINPYELLGVDYNSSLNDVRKAYYNMALILHPDKGGSKEDMIILQNSYNWIKNKLDLVQERGIKTVEEIEKEFNDFLELQNNSKPQKLSELLCETYDFTLDSLYNNYKDKYENPKLPWAIIYELISHHIYFRFIRSPEFVDNKEEFWKIVDSQIELLQNREHDTNLSTSSIHHGYGDEMVITEEQEIKPFKTDIVEYTEPESIFLPSQQVAQNTEQVSKLDDYSIQTKYLKMNDYKKAYTEYSIADSQYADLFNGKADEPLDLLMARKEIERLDI